ncbi:MAG TPA: bifunctional diguanylate cyclase/phosphodiesterase, partial [Sulfuricurvum sp.]|nr:bifunctional diguanylate cyclase/phosphodiesterase [Sulfuricurvum sp.]
NNVSRLGGDEFCVLSKPYETKQDCIDEGMMFAQRLLDTIKEIYIIDEHHLYISASIGVSLINNLKMKANTFIKEADIAMYEAKSQGRDGIILFNDALSMRVERKLEIEQLLHFALKNNEITLKYQPQLNTKEEVIGCEVLVRWHNEKLGNVGPNEFIPISEQTGLILELGYFILEESFKTLQEWDQKGIMIDQMSINISMRQLLHHNFIHDVQTLCKTYLNPQLCKKIVFEMTETSVAEDIQALVKNINILKNDGIRFSIDDFGTGYSSLSYLRQIPIDELKIDRSFIMELEKSQEGRTMVKTIINIAQNLHLSIVAEGVENEFQKDFLINNGCDILQGFYFDEALDKANITVKMVLSTRG